MEKQTQSSTGVAAYYMGRNSAARGDTRSPRSAFRSDADFTSYQQGRRDVFAEDRLNEDTEWDADND